MLLSKVFTIVNCLFITSIAYAACPDLSNAKPVRLIQNEKQNELASNLISKWKSDESIRFVKFGSYVSKTGRLENPCCMTSTHKMSRGAAQRLTRRLSQLRFSPASNLGEELRVFVTFTILAKKIPNGVTTELLLHQLHSMKDFGIYYSAPQRVWAQSMWAGRRAWSGEVSVEVQATVNELGHGAGARVLKREKKGSGIDGALLSRVELSCFIPGHHEGGPVQMPYVEAFTNF